MLGDQGNAVLDRIRGVLAERSAQGHSLLGRRLNYSRSAAAVTRAVLLAGVLGLLAGSC